MDIISVALILGSFGLFYLTINFCDRVIDEQGGKK